MPDLVIIGGGPAGLSAAVTASSEGLATTVLDSAQKFGGQAGTSTMIENYIGFPQGITGEQLTAAMIEQARKFNVELVAPARVYGIQRRGDRHLTVKTDNGENFSAPAVMLASGVQYRKIAATNLTDFLGRGVSYGSPSLASNFEGKQLYIIGGANSAGQAALHLSRSGSCEVHLLIRGQLRDKMSDYLIREIQAHSNIHIHEGCELEAVEGQEVITAVTVRTRDNTMWRAPADRLFILAGAVPKVHWLPVAVLRDTYGFPITGGSGRLPHESSIPGIFIAGDVRSGSVKRCASAIGEGATTVAEIHEYLKQERL